MDKIRLGFIRDIEEEKKKSQSKLIYDPFAGGMVEIRPDPVIPKRRGKKGKKRRQ